MSRFWRASTPSKSRWIKAAQKGTFSSRVVGCGNMGVRYSNALARLSTTPPLIVPISRVIRDPSLLVNAEFEDLQDTARPVVDITIIATVTERHAADARDFAPNTRLLLLEKPLAASVQDWRQIAQDYVVPDRIRVASPLRFLGGFMRVLDALPRMGNILTVSVSACSWLPDWRRGRDVQSLYAADRLSGGVMRDLIHEVDYCLTLFGPPLAVSAATQSGWSLGIASDSHAQVTWRYPRFLLTIALSYLSRPAERTMRIHGSFASLNWDLVTGCVTFWDHETGRKFYDFYPRDLIRDYTLTRELLSTLDPTLTPSTATISEGLQALQAVDLAYISARRGGVEQWWET